MQGLRVAVARLSHKSATVRWIGALGNIFGVYVNRYLRKILGIKSESSVS